MSLITALYFAFRCFRAFRRMPVDRTMYFGLSAYGVPQATVIVAHGREAWRVSDFAINYLGSVPR